MPVYNHTYQTWKGERRGPLFRWLAIPKFAWMEFFSKRVFIGLFTAAWLQFILRLGYLYLLVNSEFLKALGVPTKQLPVPDAVFFKNMIDVQLVFAFLFAFLLGSGLISRDLKHSAAVLYMSKPISRWEYFWGKFATLFSILMLLTWFQTLLLFAIQTAIAPRHSEWRLYFWDQYAGIPVAITVYSVIVCTTLTLMVLAASSLTPNNRYAGTTFAMYIIGSSIVAGIVRNIVEHGDALALSPFFAGVDLGFYLFHLHENHHEMSCFAAWTGVLGVWALCAVLLRWRLKNAARYGR